MMVYSLALPAWAAAPNGIPGPLGIGYWGNEHLSLRYWVSPTMALDAGIGFQFVSNATRFDLQLGLPILMKQYPALFIELRPGFELSSQQNVTTDITLSLSALAEWFLPGTENRLSVSGGPRFGITMSTPAIGLGTTTMGTSATGIFAGALHFYF